MVKKYYNREEIAKMLNVNILTIKNWVKSGYTKEYKISTNVRKLLYNLEEIEKKIKLQFKQYITINHSPMLSLLLVGAVYIQSTL